MLLTSLSASCLWCLYANSRNDCKSRVDIFPVSGPNFKSNCFPVHRLWKTWASADICMAGLCELNKQLQQLIFYRWDTSRFTAQTLHKVKRDDKKKRYLFTLCTGAPLWDAICDYVGEIGLRRSYRASDLEFWLLDSIALIRVGCCFEFSEFNGLQHEC